VAADERADARAVDRRDAGHVDDEMPLTAAEELLDVLLERLRDSARDQRDLRRKNEAIVVASVRWHVSGYARTIHDPGI
jgi:hypothetical protein